MNILVKSNRFRVEADIEMQPIQDIDNENDDELDVELQQIFGEDDVNINDRQIAEEVEGV